MNTLLFFIISWFFMGFIAMLITWICDIHNKEFNETYFEKNSKSYNGSILLILMGYISIVILFMIIEQEHKYFPKLIYKLANLKIKHT